MRPTRIQARQARRGGAGFTLIEMLAVVAIFALVASFVMPNIGALRDRKLRAQAQQIAAHLELGRQRAVMTGVPHRLLLDLDEAAYRLEWFASEAEATGTPEPPAPELDLRGDTPLPLAAPLHAERSFRPLPGRFGDLRYLADGLFFAGGEAPEGWIARGEVGVTFDHDGTASYTEIHIDDEGGRRVALDVRPLADAVVVRDAEL